MSRKGSVSGPPEREIMSTGKAALSGSRERKVKTNTKMEAARFSETPRRLHCAKKHKSTIETHTIVET
jgi:hypothetical protein